MQFGKLVRLKSFAETREPYPQQTCTCRILKIETLEKGVKYVQS